MRMPAHQVFATELHGPGWIAGHGIVEALADAVLATWEARSAGLPVSQAQTTVTMAQHRRVEACQV